MDEQTPTQQATQQPQQPDQTQILQATTQALTKKKQSQLAQDTFSPATISQAMAQLKPDSKSPTVQIGKAIATPNYAGLCLQWVDDQQGNTNRYPNAYADYQAKSQSGEINSSNKIPTGARVYFSPNDSNGGLGHVGIYQGDGKFISATDNGVKTFSVADWEKATGQSVIGWTSDKKS